MHEGRILDSSKMFLNVLKFMRSIHYLFWCSDLLETGSLCSPTLPRSTRAQNIVTYCLHHYVIHLLTAIFVILKKLSIEVKCIKSENRHDSGLVLITLREAWNYLRREGRYSEVGRLVGCPQREAVVCRKLFGLVVVKLFPALTSLMSWQVIW